MSLPNDVPEHSAGGWTPELPIRIPPPLLWPPRPLNVLRYLFGFPGIYLPWTALCGLLALGLWRLLLATSSDLTHLSRVLCPVPGAHSSLAATITLGNRAQQS